MSSPKPDTWDTETMGFFTGDDQAMLSRGPVLDPGKQSNLVTENQPFRDDVLIPDGNFI
jgi:hypothetical protein